jgi:hypothetical protein
MRIVDHRKYRELRASTPRGHLLSPTSLLQKPLCTTMEDKSRHLSRVRHRRILQLRWWLLPELLAAPPREGAIDVFFNFDSDCYQSYRQHLPGAPPSTFSSTLVVVAAGATDNTPDGSSHRRLVKLGTCRQYFSGDTYQGATTVNTTTTSKTSFRKNKDMFHEKIFSGPSGAKNPGNITAKKFQSTNYITTSFIGTTKREENYQQCGEDYTSSGSRSNHSAAARATSSTSTLPTSADPLTCPCTRL